MLSLSTIGKGQVQAHTPADATDSQSSTAPPNAPPDPDPSWHIDLNSYLWFPGTHGLIGANGIDVGYKASATDLLSNFKFGLMGAVGAQRGRVLIFSDMVWVRLGANKQLVTPIPGVPVLTAQPKLGEFILTPEFGYRFLDGERIKIDAVGGLRYWHLESSVQFSPSRFGLNYSQTANWADPLMGARIQLPVGSRVLFTVLGDAGGWGAGSELDWQLLGAVGLRLTPKWMLDGGYRYLYTDYRPGNARNFVLQTAMSGALLGVTYTLK